MSYLKFSIFIILSAVAGLCHISLVQAQCLPAVADNADVVCTGVEGDIQGSGSETGVTLTVGSVSDGLIDVSTVGVMLADEADVRVADNGQIDADIFGSIN